MNIADSYITRFLPLINDPIELAMSNGYPWSDLYTAAPGYDGKQPPPLVDLMEVMRDVSAIINNNEEHTS